MQVSLKRDGWHRKLQEYVFSNPPRFGSLCPYFWFTIFCIISFVPVFIGKSIIMPILNGTGKAIDAVLSGINKGICIPLYESQLLKTSENSLLNMFFGYQEHEALKEDYHYRDTKRYKPNSVAFKRFLKYRELWLKNNNATLEEFNSQVLKSLKEKAAEDAKAKATREAALLKEKIKSQAKEAARAKTKEKMYNGIIKYTKWLAIPFGLAILSLFGYAIYLFGSWAATWNWSVIGLRTIQILAVVVAIAFLAVIFVLLQKLARKCDLQMPSFGWMRRLGRGTLNIIKKFGGGIGAAVVSVVDFFIDYAKAAKEDYCPIINWEDK